MDRKLLAILCCPVTHRELAPARPQLLRAVNAAIREGRLTNRAGTVPGAELREGLVTDDGKSLYPVEDGIPVLLEGAGIGLEQLGEQGMIPVEYPVRDPE